jgi:hypothetical protein
MSSITSIFIPKIESIFNAEFIAEIFEKNCIAVVSRIYIEPFKPIMKTNEAINFNRAYVDIKSWYDSESAYNFIECIKNPFKEARIIYGHNKWWRAEINNCPDKLYNNTRVLTIFKDNNIDEDDLSTTAIVDPYSYYKKINIYKNNNFTSQIKVPKKVHYITDNIYNNYDRELKAKIYGYNNADEMDDVERSDGYLHQMMKKKVH